MQYLVISSYSEAASDATDELQNDVQAYLDKGWKPQGGVCVIFSPINKAVHNGVDGFEAFQALVSDGELPE